MKIPDSILDHLLNPQFHDKPSGLLLPGENRLQDEIQVWDGGWDGIANDIATRVGMAWFPDANVAILDGTESAWSALRLAGMGSSTTFISDVVGSELQEWLDDPRRNRNRAAALRHALVNNSWARRPTSTSDVRPALIDYARLIGIRRMLCLPFSEDGLTIVGTDPADKAATMDAVKKAFGPRALALAKKGRKDFEAGKPFKMHDEFHCMTAIAHALKTGQETAILTSDADCLEIFRKAQWLTKAHYRAWAAAILVEHGGYGEPDLVLATSETNGFFEGPLSLYRRPTNLVSEALPRIYHEVRVHVIYVAPDGRIFRMTSPLEREMLQLFNVRMTTGRCTDLFGDRNVHVDLSPIKSVPNGWFIGIGKDAVLTLNEDDGHGHTRKVQLPALDVEHAIQCRERIMQ